MALEDTIDKADPSKGWYMMYFQRADTFAIIIGVGSDKVGTGSVVHDPDGIMSKQSFKGREGPFSDKGLVKEIFRQFQ